MDKPRSNYVAAERVEGMILSGGTLLTLVGTFTLMYFGAGANAACCFIPGVICSFGVSTALGNRLRHSAWQEWHSNYYNNQP